MRAVSPLRSPGGVSARPGYPLSFVQERLWRIWRRQPDDSSYNVPLALHLEGPLDAVALAGALDDVVARHEALRTRFLEFHGEPWQVIDPTGSAELIVDDLTALAPDQRAERLRLTSDTQAQHAFDLTSDLLLIARLVRLEPAQHVLLLTVPHIVFDGGSVALLLAEMSSAYRARVFDGHPPNATVPEQYGAYCVLERSDEWAGRAREQLGYWTEQLRDLPTLDLPVDRPTGATAPPQCDVFEFDLTADLVARLEALGRAHRTTLYVVVLAAFQALLARYCGQIDFAVACGASYRGDMAAEAVLGCFVNTLALRAECGGNPTFAELVQRARGTVLDGYAHQTTPFDWVVAEVGHDRQQRHPLARVSLQLVPNPERYLDLPGIRARNVVPGMSGIHLDIQVQLMSREDGLLGQVIYAANLFDRDTIVRLMAAYTRVLRAVVDDPTQKLADLPVLDDADTAALTAMRSGPTAPRSDDLVAMVLDVARRDPGRVAVREPVRTTTYGELVDRAWSLAGRLCASGIGRGDVVGILLKPGADAVVATIAAWLIHAAYLPLDPGHPAVRNRTLLIEAGASSVVTGAEPVAGLSTAVIPIDGVNAASPVLHRHAYRPQEPGGLAYVRYTSGSSGRPKGVMVQHDNLRNLTAVLPRLGYETAENPMRIAVLAPLTFDASVKMTLALCFGHELLFVPIHIRRDGQELLRYLDRMQIDVMDCTPLDLRGLVGVDREALGALRPRVLVGGEPIEVDLWQRLREARQTSFHNVYGPTESTVFVSVCSVGESDAMPTLGRPIANTALYVVDPWFNQAPVGVRGELVVGGSPVARGYVGDPGSTAASFVPDPFSGRPGARLYRTGDLARWLWDGRLEFLGRLDDQVKIRGYRVEPAEIRAALLAHPQVVDAEVVAWRSDRTGPRLVGYAIVAPGASAGGDELRDFLAERLPEYLLPTGVVVVEAIPRGRNGKVNRSSLPDPGSSGSDGGAEFVAPRIAAESELAEVWQEVLGIERVGVHDNFFELGGDSITSMQIAARAVRRGVPISSGDLFERPTVAELAAAIHQPRRVLG